MKVKNSKIILSTLVFSSLFCTSGSVNAITTENKGFSTAIYTRDENVKVVYSIAELYDALADIEDADPKELTTVRLGKDLFIPLDLKIPSKTVLDLNGYNIKMSMVASLVIGTKTFVRNKPKQIWVEGKDVRRSKDVFRDGPDGQRHRDTVYYTEHIPGHHKTVYTPIYSYEDSARVTIKNGFICAEKAESGESGKQNAYWYSEACGNPGNDALPIICVKSGRVILENITIVGRDGGDGGHGTYSALWHIPFGGGNGGQGGKGGNGGLVLSLEKDHGYALLGKNCELTGGKGGIGGSGGRRNPNYWLIPGSDGEKGGCGKNGEISDVEEQVVW